MDKLLDRNRREDVLKHLKNLWSARISLRWMLASVVLVLVIEAWCYLFFWSTEFSLQDLADGPVWVFLFLSGLFVWPLTAASEMGVLWQAGYLAALTDLVLSLVTAALVLLVFWRRRVPEFLLLLAISSVFFVLMLRHYLVNPSSWY